MIFTAEQRAVIDGLRESDREPVRRLLVECAGLAARCEREAFARVVEEIATDVFKRIADAIRTRSGG